MASMYEHNTKDYGDYRSARARGDMLDAWYLANSFPQELREIAIRDWWGWVDLSAVARLVCWFDEVHGSYERGLFCSTLETPWTCYVGSLPFISSQEIALGPLAKAWAPIPGKEVAHLFESWAEEDSPQYVGLTHKLWDALQAPDSPQSQKVLALASTFWGRRNGAPQAACLALGAILNAFEGDIYEVALSASAAVLSNYGKGTSLIQWDKIWTEYVLKHYKGLL